MDHRALFVLGLVGCGPSLQGTPTRAPEVGAPVRTATTSESGGLRVLANRVARRGERGLLATTPATLRRLWSEVGLRGATPVVDLATHVVLGTNFEDGTCRPEIVAARVDVHATLSLEELPYLGWCDLIAVRVAVVVAVPRALVANDFTWRVGRAEAYRFRVPDAETAAATPAAAVVLEHPTIDAPRGTVELPEPGHLALRTLDDGREVWVVHRADGGVSVLLADRAIGEAGVHAPVGWSEQSGRLDGLYDSHGRSIHGDPPLVALTFARVSETQIAIGTAAELGDAPIEPPAAAPALEGPPWPYQDLAPTALDAIVVGRFGRVELDLVTGADGPPRLCVLPEESDRSSRGCAADAPAVTTAPSVVRAYVEVTNGPLVVRRGAAGVDLVIRVGHGSRFWAHER